MSNYGFNPDELVDTKVELIDKDGFHKVGEVADGGNGGNSSSAGFDLFTAEEGIYPAISTRTNAPGCYFFIVVDPSKHPELNDFDLDSIDTLGSPSCVIYSGDKYDISEITYDSETYQPVLSDNFTQFGQSTTIAGDTQIFKTHYYINDKIIFMCKLEQEYYDGSEDFNFNTMIKNDPVYVVMTVGGNLKSNSDYDYVVIQIEDTWRLEN